MRVYFRLIGLVYPEEVKAHVAIYEKVFDDGSTAYYLSLEIAR